MYEDFNDFEPQKPAEPVMSDAEKKSHKRLFSRLFLAFFAYIAISNALSIALSYLLNAVAPKLLNDYNFTLSLSSVIQYCIAFPILWAMLRKIPKQAPVSNPLKPKSFLKYAAVSVFFMYVGNYISSFLMIYIEDALGRTPENAVNTVLDNTNIILSIILVGIIGPITEELMFRKLFTDRLTPYGDKIAILLPSLIFGLFHGNLYQFFYAFFLGIIFSYIYVRTGKLAYTCVLHVFINLFFGILPSFVFSKINLEELYELALAGPIPEAYIEANLIPLTFLLIYEFIMYGLIFAGIFTLMRNVRGVIVNKGAVKLPKGEGADIMFFNVGAILLVTVCLIITAINTFAA